MKNLKNIDRLFQENLKDLEIDPPKVVWSKIDRSLPITHIKKTTPIWLRIGNVAALILLMFLVGKNYFNATDGFENENLILNTNEVNDVVQPNVKENIKNEIVVENKILENKNLQEKVSVTPSIKTENLTSNKVEHIVSTTQSNNNTQTNLETEAKKVALTDAVNNTEEVNKKVNESKKWSVATSVAPVYFSSLNSKGSPLDTQLDNNSIEGNSNFSYGLKVAYQLNDKLSIQSGVSLVNLGYKTNDIDINSNYKFIGLANIKYNTSFLGVNPVSGSIKGNDVASQANSNSKTGSESGEFGSLNQNFGYVEIPLEVKYSLKEGKVGVNLVGGFSTMLLNKNEIYLQTSEYTTSLGKASNLRDINFSGNIGLDVDYLINHNLFINISPMLKVQTHTFSKESGGFQPYFLGVYTGLNYKF